MNKSNINWLSKPIQIGIRSDGEKAFAVGKDTGSAQIIVAINSRVPKDVEAGTTRTLEQILKFSHPDAWEWDEEAIAKI